MIKKIILVDFDYVTADLHTEWYTRYNSEYNDQLTSKKVTEWSVHKFVKPECGMKIYDYLKDFDLYDNVQPVPYSLYYINKLKADGFRCVFLSSGVHSGKLDWLFKYEYIQDEKDLIIAKDKSMIIGNYMVDDYFFNIQEFYKTNPEGIGILFNAPHNRSVEYPFFRTYDWCGVYEMISAIERGI